MARARNIKPSFFTNDTLAEYNCPLGRLLFVGLWTLADHNGNLEWRPKKIKVQLLPYDDCDIERLAINLDKSGFIRFYSDGDKRFLNITNFLVHQNPHKNEKEKGSDIPGYSEDGRQLIDLSTLTINRELSGGKPEDSTSDPADSLIPHPDSGYPQPPSSPDGEDSRSHDPPVDQPSKKSKFVAKHLELPPEVDPDNWQRWCEYRSSKRKPITEKAAAMQVAELRKHPPDTQRVMVDNSIQNDWQGLFPPKGGTHAISQSTDRPRSAVDRVRAGNDARAAEREKDLQGRGQVANHPGAAVGTHD